MKKIISAVLLFVCINASAQNNAEEDTTSKSAITAFGIPNGDKTAMNIGKKGGSISSSDGVVTLIFPEGALSKNTNISIQPTTNMAPNGNGKAYRMEPSGIIFKKDATLVFNYENEEADNNIQALMGIAMQDDDGKWYKLNKIITDTVAKTITSSIKHFSYYVNFSKAKIFPANARVKVNGSIRLQIVGAVSEDTDDDVELVPLRIEYPTMNWSVNGIEKGNSDVGYISASKSGSAIFKAPAQIPSQNPVAISVYPVHASGSIARYGKYLIASRILVYDNAYEVTIIHSLKDAAAGTRLGSVNYLDTGSCVISIDGENSKIIEKVNKNTKANWGYTDGDCIVTLLKSGPGNVHILGTRSIKVIPPATPDGNSWIAVEFIRAPTILPLLQFKCPPVNRIGGWTTSTSATTNAMAAKMIQALPHRVKFEAKDGEQIIVDINDNTTKLKITVKKLKEE